MVPSHLLKLELLWWIGKISSGAEGLWYLVWSCCPVVAVAGSLFRAPAASDVSCAFFSNGHAMMWTYTCPLRRHSRGNWYYPDIMAPLRSRAKLQQPPPSTELWHRLDQQESGSLGPQLYCCLGSTVALGLMLFIVNISLLYGGT